MKPGFKPMLAATLTVEAAATLQWQYLLASPKLDGIRAVSIDGVLYSRNLKPIPNRYVQARFGQLTCNSMDGELILGDPTSPTCFRDTASAVMSRDGEPDVQFHTFDSFARPAVRFADRMREAAGRHLPGMVRVVHTPIGSLEELLAYEEEMLAAGYEGVMLRSSQSPYKFGRGTLSKQDLMKFKRFCDAEAVVLGAVERMHNGNAATTDALGRTKRTTHKANKTGLGTLGALRVRGLNGPYKGVEFDIGTGWTDEERKDLWEAGELAIMGRALKYKYFPSGSKDAPRFPVFLAWRPDGA